VAVGGGEGDGAIAGAATANVVKVPFPPTLVPRLFCATSRYWYVVPALRPVRVAAATTVPT